MKKNFTLKNALYVIFTLASILTSANAQTADSNNIKAQFADPPRQYSTAPLWVWNDMLSEQLVVSTLRDLAAQKIKQAFVHPRPGLMTPYLGRDWFRLWKVALQQAEKLDMNLWIYDENSYPSGFAGGLVPRAMPHARGMGLRIKEEKQPGTFNQNVLAVFRKINANQIENVTEQLRSGAHLPEGTYYIAEKQFAGTSSWYGGTWYVNLLTEGVTEKFLDVTFEPYRQHLGQHFGKRIPGSFTDEPRINPAGLPWCNDLPQLFQKRWGYDLRDNLPSLIRPIGDWAKVRHNYYQLLSDLLVKRWAKPYYQYCQKNNLQFTGHYWEHEWPNTNIVPDNMAMYAWQHLPGIDTLCNQYNTGTHAQFGNVRAVKELSSVANQLGLTRTLCEAYGAAGWDLRFEDMKRIGDWLYVLGVNLLDQHLSFVTIRGARKRDHPQSFSYHEPWWQDYHIMAEYFSRLSLVMSQGRQVNRILLIEPTTTVWMYQNDPTHRGHLNRLADTFQRLVTDMALAQIEYDLGCEAIIAQHASVAGNQFKVGRRYYDLVVIPPHTDNLNSSTVKLLVKYLENGGELICCGQPPSRVDGQISPHAAKLSQYPGYREVQNAQLISVLQQRPDAGFKLIRAENDKGILFHHRRLLEDGQVLFLANTSIDSPATGRIDTDAKGIERWNPQDAGVTIYPFESTQKGLTATFNLEPCGSLLLFLSNNPIKPALLAKKTTREIPPLHPLSINRLDENVLTLDFVDVNVTGQTLKNAYCYRAGHFVFKQHGLSRNPWDNAVQLHDSIIKKTFPEKSGFTATYHFFIEQQVPSSLYAVVERPDLYRITCNGKTVKAVRNTWWLDKSFGKIDIASCSQLGQNSLTIVARPMTVYHELEAAYIIGDFALKPAQAGFVIIPQTKKPLQLGPWNTQGYPLYGGQVSYRQRFRIPQLKGQFVVELTNWYGSIARVMVNGKKAGHIGWRPSQCNVTRYIKQGDNVVEVIVIGTLKNTLGPFHAGTVAGYAWPWHFQQAPNSGPPPGQSYHTIGYGLFRPFTLKQITESDD